LEVLGAEVDPGLQPIAFDSGRECDSGESPGLHSGIARENCGKGAKGGCAMKDEPESFH
jgi:hypothetical protein